MKIATFSLALLMSGVIATPTLATHIRAGEITAVRPSCQGFTYQFTITGYEDTESGIEFGGGGLSFGHRDAERPVEGAEFETRQIIDSKVSAGNYYYLAKVSFSGLDPNRRPREIKGWVQVMYDEVVGN